MFCFDLAAGAVAAAAVHLLTHFLSREQIPPVYVTTLKTLNEQSNLYSSPFLHVRLLFFCALSFGSIQYI